MKREIIFVRYWRVISLLIAGVILSVSGAYGYLAYRDNIAGISTIQQGEARSAAIRIDEYLRNIENQIREVNLLPMSDGTLPPFERESEYLRLLKIQPAIQNIWNVDDAGRERLFVSRVETNRAGSMRELSTAPELGGAPADGARYSRVYFRNATEPHTVIAMREGARNTGLVMLAELNLRFVSDLVAGLKFGSTGNAFIVDDADRIIAHRNPTIVLRHADRPASGAYSSIRAAIAGNQEGQLPTVWDTNLEGRKVLLSLVRVPRAGWLLALEQGEDEVLAPVRAIVIRTLILLACGLLLAFVASRVLARSLTSPIVVVQRGAAQIAGGDLATRITVDTGDEIQELATEFNHMAAQLEEYTTSLEQKVSEKTAQLELANRHKSEFLANMSHELRTPLNAVIGFSDVLENQYFGPLNDKQAQYVRDINESGQHLLSLINDILDLSKVEAGRMDLELTRFDLPAAIDNAIVLIRERALRQNLKLFATVAPEIGDLVADERKLKQILINLLTNAVKFSYPDGRVEIDAVRGTNETLITVRDTGPGIAREDQATIFEEFRQLKTTGGGKQEGTGLGLALVKRFVELHGGRIRVDSEPGQGAAFTFSLPDLALPEPA